MLITLELLDGDWQQFMTLELVFHANGMGDWRVTDPNWLNLIAYETSGKFIRKPLGGMPCVQCFDGNSEGPAFVLNNGPAGEWDKGRHEGLAVIMNPRNSYGNNIEMNWRSIRSPF